MTGNGIDTCLNLVVVREAIQFRFRHGVLPAVDSTFLSTLLRSKLVVEAVEVLTRSKGSITLNSPLNPIESSEQDPRLDVDCCGHSVENLSTMPDPDPPLLTIGRMYQQLFLAVALPLLVNGPEQLIDLLLLNHWHQRSSP